MKNIYSIIASFLIVGTSLAQSVDPSIKIAQKKLIDNNLPSIIQNNIELRSAAVDCDGSEFYCENFESVNVPDLPNNMNTSSLENNYFIPTDNGNVQVSGFFTGNSSDAGAGGYWTYLDEHTTFAMTNDDSCLPGGVAPNEGNNCDLSFEILELPELDFTGQNNMWILFEFYHDKNWGGGDASVEISFDSGSSWQDLSDGPLPETQAWQAAAYDLSAYSDSSSVTIRFLWSDGGSWASGFAVDDIVINPLPAYAMKLNQAIQVFPSTYFGATTYHIAPLAQAQSTAYNFAGYIQNMGLNTLDSARVYAEIVSEGFSTQSNGVNTISLDQDTLFCNDVFTAPSTGIYTVNVNAADSNTQTQTTNLSFEVTEFDYARDDAGMSGDYTGGSYVNDAGSEQRGNVFDIYADATLYALKVRAHPATSPNCAVKAIINTVIPGDGTEANPTTYAFFTESAEINIGDYTDGWTNIMFDPPVNLFAGDIILATISATYNGVDTLVIGTSGNVDPGETMLQDIDGTQPNGNPGDWYYTTTAPMVRLNFDPNATGPSPIASVNNITNSTKFNVYPNPNNGIFNVSIGNSSEINTIEITNVIGQTIYSKIANNSSSNVIDLSNLNKGIYFISLKSDQGISSSKKITIQ